MNMPKQYFLTPIGIKRRKAQQPQFQVNIIHRDSGSYETITYSGNIFYLSYWKKTIDLNFTGKYQYKLVATNNKESEPYCEIVTDFVNGINYWFKIRIVKKDFTGDKEIKQVWVEPNDGYDVVALTYQGFYIEFSIKIKGGAKYV